MLISGEWMTARMLISVRNQQNVNFIHTYVHTYTYVYSTSPRGFSVKYVTNTTFKYKKINSIKKTLKCTKKNKCNNNYYKLNNCEI